MLLLVLSFSFSLVIAQKSDRNPRKSALFVNRKLSWEGLRQKRLDARKFNLFGRESGGQQRKAKPFEFNLNPGPYFDRVMGKTADGYLQAISTRWFGTGRNRLFHYNSLSFRQFVSQFVRNSEKPSFTDELEFRYDPKTNHMPSLRPFTTLKKQNALLLLDLKIRL